jgi:shikimate kinase
MSLKKTVVLVGMMGSGKTAVGKALAAEMRVEFKDSDQEISLAANSSIAEIFERDGEPFFVRSKQKCLSGCCRARPASCQQAAGHSCLATIVR